MKDVELSELQIPRPGHMQIFDIDRLHIGRTATQVIVSNRFQSFMAFHRRYSSGWALLLFSMQAFWMAFADLTLTLLLSTLLPVATILVVVYLGI